MRVLAFGDSITQGFFDSEGGWVNRIRREYDELFIETQDTELPTVFNLGISGDTTHSILQRIESEIVARQWPGEELVIVVATGTNDTVYRGSENDSEPKKYAEELEGVMKVVQKYSSKIMFVGLFPVIDSLLQPMPWSSTGKCYSTERMNLFNETLKEFCQTREVPYVDLWAPFEAASELERLFLDGIHPSNVGHALIAQTIKPKLQELIA